MPSIKENLERWDRPDWAHNEEGEKWSALWGGSESQWFGSLQFRLHPFLPCRRILEIGPGTGHALLSLASSPSGSGRAYGIDLSGGMLGVARGRVSRHGLLKRVELCQGDGAKLPFDARCFDAVFMSFTLELFAAPEIPEVLGECQRVLRSGGRVCIVALSNKKNGWMARMYERAHARLPQVVDCRPIPVQQVIREAGFEILEVKDASMWGLPVEIVLAVKEG